MVDVYFSSVKFLTAFSAGGSIPSVDRVGNAISAAGNTALVSDAGALAGYALSMDGSGDWVSTPGVSSLQLGSGDYTIDFKISTTSSGKMAVDYYDASTTGWQIEIASAGVKLWNQTVIKTGAIPVNDGGWHHVAIVRRSGVVHFYIDGVEDGTGVANTTNHNKNVSVLAVGAQVSYRNAAYDIAAKFDYVRITVGVARWAAPGFSLPTRADVFSQPYAAEITESAGVGVSSGALGLYGKSISEFAELDASASAAFHFSVSLGLGLSDVGECKKNAVSSVIEGLSLAVSAASVASLSGSVVSSIRVSDSSISKLVANAKFSESISLYQAEILAGNFDEAIALWVANIVTQAHSRYAGFNFNSFCRFEGKYYGCKSDGIYELTGDTDGANPIPCTVTFAETDFGASNLKRFESVYLGVKASGQLVLKVVQDASNVYHYNVIPSGNDGRAARAVLGRGLTGRYWQLELASDTERFELDSIDYSFATLSRRV